MGRVRQKKNVIQPCSVSEESVADLAVADLTPVNATVTDSDMTIMRSNDAQTFSSVESDVDLSVISSVSAVSSKSISESYVNTTCTYPSETSNSNVYAETEATLSGGTDSDSKSVMVDKAGQSESVVTTDKEVQTVENASGAVSTMPTSSLISNSNSVTDDLDEEDYVSDKDYDYKNNSMAEFELNTKLDYLTELKEKLMHFQNS